ncbi:hypothetical protein C4546_00495 [Candidatus Parcubacteria bacterium]|nr:MAG: hypothetical protein C4546_00495 [Candidatus Parcubacteria bacterium]
MPVPKFSIRRLIYLGLAVLGFWVMVQVSRTGLWQIPWISRIFYNPPQPIRVVAPADISFPSTLAKIGQGLLATQVLISENEMTRLLSDSLTMTRLGISRPNLVVEPESLEFSFLIPQRNNAQVRLYLFPLLNDKKELDFQIQKTLIGEVKFPSWIIGQPTRLLLAQELNTFLKASHKPSAVKTQSGNLVLNF